MNFYERTKHEQDIIALCYETECELIAACSSKRNPYIDALRALPDGEALWAAFNDAIDMHYHAGD